MKVRKSNNMISDFNYIKQTILKLHGETAEMFEIQLRLLVESLKIDCKKDKYLPKNNVVKVYIFNFNNRAYGLRVLFIGEPLRVKQICMN